MNELRRQVDASIDETLGAEIGVNELTIACSHALKGGKRLRPLLVLAIYESLQKGGIGVADDAMDAALAMEFMHTASLVIDDLPCMDNDSLRRGRPSVHVQFGEAVAQLVSVSLVSSGFSLLLKNVESLGGSPYSPYDKTEANAIGMQLMKQVALNLGSMGAAGGQFLDMSLFINSGAPPTLGQVTQSLITPDTVVDAIHRKTSTFFEMAILTGWLLGGGHFDEIPQLKLAAKALGLAYQITDDIEDVRQDYASAQGKNRAMNYTLQFGLDKALATFYKSLHTWQETFTRLGIWSEAMQQVADLLIEKVKQHTHQALLFLCEGR